MAEQSSTVAAFRALVMLICLILIPVAAFCGSSFPAVVKAIQDGRWPALADFRGPSAPPASPALEAPRFISPVVINAPQATPKTSGFSNPALGLLPSETPRSPVITANYNAPISTPAPGEAGQSTNFPQNKDSAIGLNRGLSPVPTGVGNLLSLNHPAVPARLDDPASPAGTTSSSFPTDQFKYVQDRLRQLGATYYLLETCGNEKREFRFYCRMSIGGDPRVTKSFSCFDCDPLKAMTQVLKLVEDWQTRGG
jgi:hypothetical protein